MNPLFVIETDEADRAAMARDITLNVLAQRLQLTDNISMGMQILETCSLTHLADYIFDFNPSASTADYHNSNHEMAVVCAAYEGARFHELPMTKIRICVIAAAMHDYDHSGGLLPDSKNIARALKGLDLAYKALLTTSSAFSLADKNEVADIITCTEFPFIYPPLTIEAEIVRDADLMMAYFKDIRVKLFKGLIAELATGGRKIESIEDFAETVKEFYTSGIAWHTSWAKQKSITNGFDNELNALCEELIKEKI